MFNKIGFILIVGLIWSCQDNSAKTKPQEIINFITLESGKTDTLAVDEIFFAPEYNIKVETDKDIEIAYLKSENLLVIKPNSNYSGLKTLHIKNHGNPISIPLNVKKKTAVKFHYKPDQPVSDVFVMGSFNNWNRSLDRLADDDNDGAFETTLYLDDGIYEYQFVADKKEFPDPENPEKVDNGFGSFNSIKRVISAGKENRPNLYFLPEKDSPIVVAVESNASIDQIEFHLYLDNQLLNNDAIIKYNKIIEIDFEKIKSGPGIHTLRMVASYKNQPGNVLYVWLEDGKLLPANKDILWNDAIIYSLMVDRFRNGNSQNDSPVEHSELAKQANFNGGDLAGIFNTLKEGYFDSLGINTLWISPLNKTTDKAFHEWPEPHRYFTGYHGYWPVSSTEVEPRFGSLDQFRQLVKSAHQKDLKILLDFLANHTHQEHPYFKKHRNWFGQIDLPNGEKNVRLWESQRLTTWFDIFIPSFDYLGSEEALEVMTDNAIWWLEQTDVDGFRHDATKHVPYKFWKRLTKKIKTKVDPHKKIPVYQIGETFGGYDLIKSYLNNGMLDAQFNFNQFFTARRIFVEEGSDFADLASSIEKALEVYGYAHKMGNIMDSHDQIRMMSLLEGDLTLSDDGKERAWDDPPVSVNDPVTYKKAQIYMAYLLTTPGVPIIYYGDEFGMTGADDPDNRRMMRFGDQLTKDEQAHLKQVSRLIRLRKDHSALRRGDYKTMYAAGDVLVYSRGDGFERMVIMLNKGKSNQKVEIHLPSWLVGYSLKYENDNEVELDKEILKIELEPYSVKVFNVN
jgi:cyclomaltodextrinase